MLLCREALFGEVLKSLDDFLIVDQSLSLGLELCSYLILPRLR